MLMGPAVIAASAVQVNVLINSVRGPTWRWSSELVEHRFSINANCRSGIFGVAVGTSPCRWSRARPRSATWPPFVRLWRTAIRLVTLLTIRLRLDVILRNRYQCDL